MQGVDVMMFFLKGCGAALALALVSGCATAPVPVDQAAAVPESRMFTHALDNPTATSGRVIIKRDRGVVGSACTIRLFVGGEPIADIEPAEKVVLHLSPRDHVVSAQPQGSMCSSSIVETSLTITTNGAKMLRIGFSASMDPVLQPTAF